MINIKRFAELLAELTAATNSQSDAKIAGWLMCVNEGHAVKKLRDRRGVWLVAKYPDSLTAGNEDMLADNNEVVLFLIEKVSSGSQSDTQELDHYSVIQDVYKAFRGELLSGSHFCKNMQMGGELKEEWEYDIFGGWNGISVSFNLESYD